MSEGAYVAIGFGAWFLIALVVNVLHEVSKRRSLNRDRYRHAISARELEELEWRRGRR